VNIFDQFIVQPIFNLLVLLYSIIPGGDFGISIIVFTILVRFALYPLLKRQLHQTKAMRKLQPELALIKKQAKGNKQLESMQMLELYKKHGVNPFRSIGILLIQLPIFISLYYVIQIFTSKRGEISKFTYDFLENLGPIKQLIEHPDKFNEKLLGLVDLTKPAFSGHGIDIILVALAIVAAYTQYIMSKQTMPQQESKKRLRDLMAEAAEGKGGQAEMNAVMMTKMMKFLPIFMFFIMVSIPGAIALYYGVSNIVAVTQQSRILKKDTDELEEIAEHPTKSASKKATAKGREKAAKEAHITKIVAKPTSRRNK
jgi:YidC/Oxa1 family membrane protein insertase